MISGNKFIDQMLAEVAGESSSKLTARADGVEKVRQVSRRDFLRLTSITAGSGLILGACSEPSSTTAVIQEEACEGVDIALNVFLRIGCDNQITLTIHRSEMGQGIRTGIAQVLAEDLDVDWSALSFEQAVGDKKFGEQNTDGSQSIRHDFFRLRKLSAAANLLLRMAAAQLWELAFSEVYTENGAVLNKVNDKTASYGQLAELASTLKAPEESEIALKDKKDWRLINKEIKSIDIENFVRGKAEYGYDVELPGMLYASVERCPTLGGKLLSCDEEAARAVPGVVELVHFSENTWPVLFQPWHGVAVIAKNTWAAMQARKKLNCQWEAGENASHSSAAYYDTLVARVKEPGEPSNQRGDVEAVFANAKSTHEAVYTTPYLPHSPMEPPSAAAHFKDGKCEVWAPTQAPQGARDHVSKALGIEQKDVTVNVQFLGGAFGRKSKPDFIIEAAMLSKEVGAPVKVCWTREDDMGHDYFHAMSAQYYKASLDGQGGVDAWLQRTAFPSLVSIFDNAYSNKNHAVELSLGFDELPVDVPNLQHENAASDVHLRIGWFRSVSNIHHAFSRSSFIDELAHLTNTHPLTFLEKMIGSDEDFDPKKEEWSYTNYFEKTEEHPVSRRRLKDVARTVVEKSGFDTNLSEGHGWGLAAHRSFVAYVAIATKVKVEGNNVSVEEVHCAIDCGIAVNPDRVRAQMEGAVIMGMGLSMLDELTVTNGVPDKTNFDSYAMMRIKQCPPKIVTHIINGSDRPGGVGEPGLPPVAPSITNAIFAATGKRIRDLPISKHYTLV